AETALAHVGLFLKGRQGADSWKPIELARNYVDVNRTGVYDELFFREGVKFQYPPTALVLVGRAMRPALNVVSWIATLTTALLTVAIFRMSVARALADATLARWPLVLTRDVMVLVLALTFYPLMK